jgi:hypothetical protein
MDQATHNRIVSFIWGIAEDVLRDLFKRGNTRMQISRSPKATCDDLGSVLQ